MLPPKVILVVLNWNKPDDTVECLESCRQIDYDNFEVVIVDNHSADGSAAIFKKQFPDVYLIENPENIGYAGGNNVGIRWAMERKADYIFLLNNDIVLDRAVLRELVGFAESRPEAGMLAPKVMYYDDRAVVNSMGTSMDWLRLRPKLGECNRQDRGQYAKPVRKDILVGCSLLLRRGTVERIGVIDEKFFIFHEAADWCLRNLKSGSENWTVPSAVIYHKASKTMREVSALTLYYSTRNFLYMAHKNANPWRFFLTRIGLSYLWMKNLALSAFGNGEKKKMAGIFFLGVRDYFAGQMGKCQRAF